jgi:predicted nucleic acid-binding protein
MPFVMDCSVTLSWVFHDERTEATEALLDSLVEDLAVVPAIWPLEVANAILTARRRRRLQAADLSRIRDALTILPIEIEATSAEHVLANVLPLAERLALSAHDASYLELARRLELPLATLDAALARAARRAGLEVLPG